MKRLNEAGPSFTKVTEQVWLARLQEIADIEARTLGPPKKTKRYKINEIFYTIQGEGLHVGEAAVFIRFSACNLACSWCDTEYDSGVMMEAAVILKAVVAVQDDVMFGSWKALPIVVCTGGEPSLQIDVAFVQAFAAYQLTMETNGIKWRNSLHGFHTVTVSPKGLQGWWPLATRGDCSNVVLKVVYDPANPDMAEIMDKALALPAKDHFLQPLENQEDGSTNVKDVIQIVQKNPRWRLSLQTHKALGLR